MRAESFEPLISWGLRMGISGTVPLLWGLAYNRPAEAVWITLSAEAVSWVELKGAFGWRVRTLFTGAFMTVLFAVIGMLTGFSIVLTALCMFAVAFLATLLKNIGDRASGLAICVYLMFIFSNANPDNKLFEIKHRLVYIAVGASFAVFTGIIASLIEPAQQPYRRQIALIFKAIASLVATIAGNKDTVNSGAPPPELYDREKDVRAAMDNSLKFFEKLAHQVSSKENQHYQLAQVRKSASLIAVNVMAMADEMEQIHLADLDESLRLKAAAMYWALQEAVSRVSVYVLTLKPEEKVLALSQINRLRKLSVLIYNYPVQVDAAQKAAMRRILHLAGRTAMLLENAIKRIDAMGKDKPVIRSYSLIKTSFVLKPKYLLRNMLSVFDLTTLTARYALRSAIAATIAIVLYKYFHIDHGYWLPFSVMIIIQPYFGATFKKAVDRVVGTLLGGLAGTLLLHIPADLHFKEVILFITFITMVYYVRKNYAIAVFAVTINLVLLFHIEASNINIYAIMITRALCTTGGALLAVVSGFALLPTWDEKWLPVHINAAVRSNYDYFFNTLYNPARRTGWTRLKRIAESRNSDVFDSFNRYLAEPGKEKKMTHYDLITHNVRLTRNLNNINTEQEEKQQTGGTPPHEQQLRAEECRELFVALLQELHSLLPDEAERIAHINESGILQYPLNEAQMISLEKIIIELKTMHMML